MKKQRITYAAIFAVLLLIEIGIGLFVHDDFLRPYVGDVLVTVLLCYGVSCLGFWVVEKICISVWK